MKNFENTGHEQKSEPLYVDIWSDIVCPFCYIGKRNFEEAVDKAGLNDLVKVVWHSFELAPDAETNPDDSIYDVLAKRKGWSLEESKEIHEQMEQRAKESGLEYNFDQTVPANSFKAHKLLHLGNKKDVQNEVKERLLKAYFTEGKNIDDYETLVITGKQAGLKENEIREALCSEIIESEVRKDIENAQKLGIQGVPFFVIHQKYAISGAQPVDVFEQALEKVKSEL